MDKIYFGIFCKDSPDNLSRKKNNYLRLVPWGNISSESSPSSQIVLLGPPRPSNAPPTSSSLAQFFTCIQDQVDTVLSTVPRLTHFSVIVPEEYLVLEAVDWSSHVGTLLRRNSQLHFALILPSRSSTAFQYWSCLQDSLKYPLNLSVFLYVGDPVEQTNDISLSTWKYEPVSSLILPITYFSGCSQQNMQHYALSTYIQETLKDFCTQARPLIILSPINSSSEVTQGHMASIERLFSSFELPPVADAVIRDPLQPLRDDLSMDIYSIFEQDETKYRMYGRAIAQAIIDIRKKKSGGSEINIVIDVLIVGPGRGPLIDLVDQCSSPSTYCNIIAVEKNPLCTNLLKKRRWTSGSVTVVQSDIREYQSEVKFDLAISELLGSFACNELSPDILAHVAAEVMIPSSYTNYLQPIYSPIISKMVGKVDQWERPYVVDITEGCFMETGPVQSVWSYDHQASSNDLDWNVELKFEQDLPDKGLYPTHGLLGYFTSVLYGEISIGIHPKQRANNNEYCNSWSPLYFPIKKFTFYTGRVIMERVTGKEGVHYQWDVNGVMHNQWGASYTIGN
ncbi:hypothetical protein CLIB1423_20S00452 [[Candida] railenensis]|uniref:Protein arginine N-methyltransferase n=1 Tax=[Candida] railenensis TaxID=45579 RepID=A0A9P0QTY4_9ASCO|nr:hypothetical protein CLIB1423_20S00452 [[Candida] railenensis]